MPQLQNHHRAKGSCGSCNSASTGVRWRLNRRVWCKNHITAVIWFSHAKSYNCSPFNCAVWMQKFIVIKFISNLWIARQRSRQIISSFDPITSRSSSLSESISSHNELSSSDLLVTWSRCDVRSSRDWTPPTSSSSFGVSCRCQNNSSL